MTNTSVAESAPSGGSLLHGAQPAIVALEDGTILAGRSVGAPGTRLGEMVFTTGMSGYQEAATDPSYAGQILCFAAPMIGNYGTGPTHMESRGVQAEALVMANAGDRGGAAGPEGWCTWLRRNGVVAIDGVDTRALVTRLRDAGTMRGGVSTERTPDELVDLARAHPSLDGVDMVTAAAGVRRTAGTDGPTIVAIDCGMKSGIERALVGAGCRLEVVPAGTGREEILGLDPDGIFLSNGPGDPAGAASVVSTIRALLGVRPLFGICMGHQLLARALDLDTGRLPFGHRGGNHPVRREDDGGIEITVQNHGYAVRDDRMPAGVIVTRRSLFDGSVEGLAAPELRAWSVQYHPEARPGPNDASYLFDRFVAEVSR